MPENNDRGQKTIFAITIAILIIIALVEMLIIGLIGPGGPLDSGGGLIS